MSFLAKLYINDRVINVLDCRISFKQNKDITGKPVGRIHGGQFVVTIEADSHTDILHQMMATNQMLDGYLRFFKRDGMSKMIDYEFRDCHVARYKADFSSQTSKPMTVQLLFSPGILRIGDVVHKKPWHVTNLEAEEVEPTPEAPFHGEPQLLQIYYTDLNGQPIEELYEDNLMLVIESRSCVGKDIDIDIANDFFDFEYKGKHVEDDIIKNVRIQSDEHKLELKVYRTK